MAIFYVRIVGKLCMISSWMEDNDDDNNEYKYIMRPND